MCVAKKVEFKQINNEGLQLKNSYKKNLKEK